MEPQPAFRITPQLMLIVLLVLLALSLPLAVTSWFVFQHFRQTPAARVPAESVEIPGLRGSLEAMADSALPTTLMEESNVFEVSTPDPAGKQAELVAWIQSVGGTSLEMPSDNPESLRMLITITAAQKAAFIQIIYPEQPVGTSQETQDSDSLLLDVRILKSK